MKMIIYSLAYETSPITIYQVMFLLDNGRYFYLGKSFLSGLPSAYYRYSREIFDGNIKSQTLLALNKNTSLGNYSITRSKVEAVNLLNGNYLYTVNAHLSNGYIFVIAFLKIDISWNTVYSFYLTST